MSELIAPEAPSIRTQRSRFRVLFARDKKAWFGIVVLVLFVLGAVFAPWLAPYDPNEMTMDMMARQGHWDDQACFFKHAFVCEFCKYMFSICI